MTEQPHRPVPVSSSETEPFWEACRREELVIQKCRSCGRRQVHYRSFCAECWSEDVEDVTSAGTGEIWSYTIVERSRLPGFADQTPYAVAVVTLDEGVRVLGNVVNWHAETL